MMHPQVGTELSRASVEGRRGEAARGGVVRDRRPPVRVAPAGIRVALGSRLVRAGHRLIGDTVEVG